MTSADDLISLVRADFDALNDLLISQLGSEVDLVETVSQYLIQSGGKRVRPLLTLLAARALGTENTQHIAAAAVIECLHTATLLHDDVVDESKARRGQPSANVLFGNAPSVLVGDFVYSRAFQLMVGIGDLALLRLLADTTNLIAEGEVWQLNHQFSATLTEADYEAVITRKTAVLFEAAAGAAGLVCGANTHTVTALKRYGMAVGLAFQLMDDWLDYGGESTTLGKNVGDDLADGKTTLPLLVARDRANEADRNLLIDAITSGDRTQFSAVCEVIRKTGGLTYTRARAESAVADALSALNCLPASTFKEGLEGLARLAVQRTS